MRADIHDGREHMLQSEAGYIDARPHRQDRRNLLYRTAGPYIWVNRAVFGSCRSLADVRNALKADADSEHRPRSAQDSNRPNHKQPEWKHSTPKLGIASKARPGNSSHCRPNTMNSSSTVTRSTTHTIGGKGVAKAPMASEMPAMAKARASRFLENLRVSEIGVPALVGCLVGLADGSVIGFAQSVIDLHR